MGRDDSDGMGKEGIQTFPAGIDDLTAAQWEYSMNGSIAITLEGWYIAPGEDR